MLVGGLVTRQRPVWVIPSYLVFDESWDAGCGWSSSFSIGYYRLDTYVLWHNYVHVHVLMHDLTFQNSFFYTRRIFSMTSIEYQPIAFGVSLTLHGHVLHKFATQALRCWFHHHEINLNMEFSYTYNTWGPFWVVMSKTSKTGISACRKWIVCSCTTCTTTFVTES